MPGTLTGVVVAGGSVLVVDSGSSTVLRVEPVTGARTTVASVPDSKPCVFGVALKPCEPGLVDHKPMLAGMAVDHDGAVLVADAGQATIWRIAPGATTVVPWYQADDLATGDGPSGLAVDAAGDVWFTAGSTLDAAHPGGGGVYRLAHGTMARSLVAAFGSSDHPGSVAVATDGTAYVVLRGPGSLVAIRESAVQPVATDTPPTSVATDGRRVLVTSASDGRWDVRIAS